MLRRLAVWTAGRPLMAAAIVSTASVVLAGPAFVVTVDPAVRSEPYTGRVYVFFSRTVDEPRTAADWFHPEPILAKDVVDWKPGESLTITGDDPAVIAFPEPVDTEKTDGYRVQAVARFNAWPRDPGTGAGNGYGAPVKIDGDSDTVSLAIDRIVKERPYVETAWGKLLEVRSERLSTFHGRDVALRATVILPSSYYNQPLRRYPVIFSIPGFGGDHRIDPVREPIPEQNANGVEFLRVMLDPNMPTGHHVFADSENNGPVGTALVEEFLPAFDKAFRSIPAPTARFLTGHSSGGWSSLWVQVSHPDSFGGVWSTAPDPVDFRDFQQINLYRSGENIYFDADGEPRPIARRNGQAVLLYRDFDRMEQTLGHGGQLQSFEAVFGPRGSDGKPVPLWDRKTGRIDSQVAEHWKRYDIRAVLDSEWPRLGPKLAGKIHVFMGTDDTFYLEGATRLLKESLAAHASDAVVELVPGRDHFNLLSPDLTQRIRREMTKSFLQHHPAGQ